MSILWIILIVILVLALLGFSAAAASKDDFSASGRPWRRPGATSFRAEPCPRAGPTGSRAARDAASPYAP